MNGLTEITKDEEMCAKNALMKLESFEKGIRVVLDIHCSPFKRMQERIKVQNSLLKDSFDKQVQNLKLYDELNEIFEHDHKHCGKNIGDNGRIYKVYLKLWRSQIELLQYKNTINRFKTWSNIRSTEE